MKIELNLSEQHFFVLCEMVKYRPMIEYDRYNLQKNVEELVYCLVEEGMQRFSHWDDPNESGFTLNQMTEFLHSPIIVDQDS